MILLFKDLTKVNAEISFKLVESSAWWAFIHQLLLLCFLLIIENSKSITQNTLVLKKHGARFDGIKLQLIAHGLCNLKDSKHQ